MGAEEHAGQLCGELLPCGAAAAHEEHAGGYRLRWQPRPEAAGFLNGNQKNSRRPRICAAVQRTGQRILPRHSTRSYSNYNALEVRYEQRMVAGLTLLNSFTWEHSLDNAGVAGRQYAFAAGCQQPARRLRAIGLQPAGGECDQPCVRSAVRARPPYLGRSNGGEDALLGGWQVSAINTAQAGTPFNLTYTPNSAQLVSHADFGELSRCERIPAERGAGAESDAGAQRRARRIPGT